jgi:biopolymer transport protein ExbD
MNVIPFIDIMLVLLAVVLTTATFAAQGKIPVALPSATEAEPLEMKTAVEITVSRSGEVFVAEDQVAEDELARRLAELEKETEVLLRVDEKTEFQYFVSVIDLLKREQLKNVSIVTLRNGN